MRKCQGRIQDTCIVTASILEKSGRAVTNSISLNGDHLTLSTFPKFIDQNKHVSFTYCFIVILTIKATK